MAMKYIMMKTDRGETPVIFPDTMFHDQVAGKLENDGCVSAGYVRLFSNGKVQCYGKSTGLHIPAREEEDSAIIEKLITA